MTGTDIAVPSFTSQVLATNDLFTVSTTGLVISEQATPEQVEAIAHDFATLGEVTQWSVGDLALFYQRHHPKRYAEFLQSPPSGLDDKTIRLQRAVAEFYPQQPCTYEINGENIYWPGRAAYLTTEQGRRALSFQYFVEMRRVGIKEAILWLERAASERMSLKQLLQTRAAHVAEQDDAPPVPTTQPISQKGYIYTLPGGHKLLCGDSRNTEHVAALFGTERASMIWTDPPYGVDYVSIGRQIKANKNWLSDEQAGIKTIDHDQESDLPDLLRRAWAATTPVCIEGAPFYVAGPSGQNMEYFLASFREADWDLKQMLVWVKNVMVFGRSDYHLQHEPIFYGYLPGDIPLGRIQGLQRQEAGDVEHVPGTVPGTRWHGNNDQTSVFEVKRPHRSDEHPTMKPVDLIVPHILNSSAPGDIVFDPFAGSGSTLIAAHKTGRRAFLVEYDERYADVIQNRFDQYLLDEQRANANADAAAVIIEGTATQTMPEA